MAGAGHRAGRGGDSRRAGGKRAGRVGGPADCPRYLLVLGASPLAVKYPPPPPTSSLLFGVPEMVQSDSSGKRGEQITRVRADLERSGAVVAQDCLLIAPNLPFHSSEQRSRLCK